VRGKPVIIRCDRQRYRCQECKETFLQPLPEIDDNRRMTKRLIEYIGEQALKKPFTDIADEVGLDEKTIRRRRPGDREAGEPVPDASPRTSSAWTRSWWPASCGPSSRTSATGPCST
jgi:transposase